MEAPNPFTPSFGRVPAHYAGRAALLSTMSRAFSEGGSNPNLATLLVGPRGTGKTALLASIAQDASSLGWVCAQVSAGDGMLADIVERVQESASELVDQPRSTQVKSFSVGQTFSIEFDRDAAPAGNWRTQMNAIIKQLAPYDTGLLITVDEVRADVEEMKQLASVYQHFVSEGKKVALVMAGLPSEVSDLVSDRSVSFLRRARQHHLGRVSDGDIEVAFRRTLADEGADIEDDALARAVSAIEGFPFMLQLVGYWTWEQALGSLITAVDVERGIRLAEEEFRDGVLAATFRELSKGDLRFLEAMLDDEGPSTLADISARMGVKSNYASKYRERLLSAGVIGSAGGGAYTVDLPGFKAFLREKHGR